MAIDPNVFYRAGAIKGQLDRQQNRNRGRAIENLGNQVLKVGEMISEKKDQYDKNMTDFNGEIPRDVVPEETMMQLTRHIAQKKAVYTKNAKIMRSSLSRKKKREASEENEKIKTGLSNVYADFQKANDMGKSAEKVINNMGDGVKLDEKDNALDFANNEWWKRGIKFSDDGMTVDGTKEGEDGKIISYDQRLSDISFPKAVKGSGGSLIRQSAMKVRATASKGTQIDDNTFEVMKQDYIQNLKNMPAEEQRHLYFNGLGGFEGSSQAETDAAKAMNLDADGFKNMKALIDEDNPNYEGVMKQREEFQNQMNILTTRKDFLTPDMVENQWSTVKNAYQSGLDEYDRLNQAKKDDKAEQRALNKKETDSDLGRSLNDGIFANDTRVKEYMGQIKNNDKIMYSGNSYYPKDGGYQMKEENGDLSEVMSKRDMATIIGVPVSGFANEIDNSKKMDKLNLDVKDFNGVDITSGTYTVVGDVAYTKEDFMKKVNDGSLTQQEIVEGGKNQVELQNSRGKQ